MSDYAIPKGISQTSVTLLTNTSVTTLLATQSNAADLTEIAVANESGSAATITLDRYDGSTARTIFKGTVAANDTLFINFDAYRLLSTQSIRGTAGTGNVLTCHVSYKDLSIT